MTKRVQKASADALRTALDGNPEIRAALIRRMTVAAEKVPVVLLHQVCQSLELIRDESSVENSPR